LIKKTLANQPLAFFDRLNHSSLYQAIFLSGAKLIRYKHNDWQDLAKLMSQYQHDNRPKFIVTETVFGMDGDVAPLDEIVRLAREYQAFLYLDEAHATGIIGNTGYGLSTTVDLSDIPSVIMGTFSKALGSSGAYIACSEDIKNYIINFCPGFIYSTANAPFSIGAAAKAWQILPKMSKERAKLQENSIFFKEHCKTLGLNIGNTTTNIIPIILNTEEKASQITVLLRSHGIKVSCIKPPTVPPGSSRIRIAINVNHSKKDIKKLISALKYINK
jgi:8-amino-7-oxononanoate synthase